MPIATERLLLRRFSDADAETLAAYRSDPEVARYQSWDAPFPLDRARAAVQGFQEADPEAPGWFQWAIERTAGGAHLGDLGVHLHHNRRQAGLGFTLAAQFQGRGYATEAVLGMLDHLFRVQGLHKVSAECDARNVRSAALLTRAGFRQEGHLRAHTWFKGEWADDLLFGLLAEDRRS